MGIELYGRRNSGSSGSDRAQEWVPVDHDSGIEESMRSLGMTWNRDSGYPERPGERDCNYYMRTGSCNFGIKCRFNHPRQRNSSSVRGAVRFGGEHPERPGEPTCQFYSRTGTCKFGASCKFHHPKAGDGYSNIRVNSHGYPLRPGETECSYYLKTGQCKFGIACKFHHPQLNNNMSVPVSARPLYHPVQTSSLPSPDQYRASYRAGRPPPLLPGSYVAGAYGPVLMPSGIVSIPSWNTYSGQVSPVMSPNAQPTVAAAGSVYGVASLSSPTFAGPYRTFSTSLGPSSSNNQKGNAFPVRPGEPDCQYYLKAADCKFGSACRFNHPPDWVVSKTNCAVSHLGLPLRPGMQPCSFYMQNGHCKFGRMCKFDHPIGTVRYSPSGSSLTEIPISPCVIGSPLAPSFSYTEPKSDSHSSRGPSSGNTSTSSVGFVFSQTGPLLSNVQLSNQSSTPLTISISARQGGEIRHNRS